MTVAPLRGTPKPPAAPSTGLDASSQGALDAAVVGLKARQADWVAVTVAERIALLDELTHDILTIADRWTAACQAAEGLDPAQPSAGEESLVGPYFILRNLRLLRKSLVDIAATGSPRVPGPIRTLPSGQVSARVFPQDLYDRIFYTGVTAEVWMEPGVTAANLADTQAVAYKKKDGGGVCLVLGGGNVSSIGPMDALYKLFVENRVVVYKVHPVNVYLGPLLEDGFRALIDRGFLRQVYGGAAEGAYLAAHRDVDEIHITGSDKTYEAIVFGPGPAGEARKRENRPVLAKPVSAELGNVSPVIVVPGPWSEGDLAYHAENLVTMLTNNAGFNCNATRVIVTDAGWSQRESLLRKVRELLRAVPTRKAYYPGAADRYDTFLARHPEAERFGAAQGDHLAWAFLPGLDPARRDEICYTTEAFCGLFGETPLSASSIPAFIEKAVAFANESLWGTLNATLLVHPRSLKDPEVARAVEKAIADLRYGTVAINHWAATGYGLVVTPWGAYPGHDRTDIQSGTGVVHNTLMFSRVQKSVVRAPFRVFPKPVWFATHRQAHKLAPKLSRFEAAPSLAKLPGIFALALRG
jgi:hypothetical protein